MDENGIREIIKKNKGGVIEKCYGPNKLNKTEVWEVWVKKEGLYETRFIVGEDLENSKYFDEFVFFAAHANYIYEELWDKYCEAIDDRSHMRKIELFKLRIAAFAFLLCVSVVIYIFATGKANDINVLLLVGGVIASASAVFFGRWHHGFTPAKGFIPR